MQHYTDQSLLIFLPCVTEKYSFSNFTGSLSTQISSPPLLTNVAWSVCLTLVKHNAVSTAERRWNNSSVTHSDVSAHWPGRPVLHQYYTVRELLRPFPPGGKSIKTRHSRGTHSEKCPTRATGGTGHNEMGDRDSCRGVPDDSFNWFQMTTVSRCPQVLKKRDFTLPREQSQWEHVYVFGVLMYVFGTNGWKGVEGGVVGISTGGGISWRTMWRRQQDPSLASLTHKGRRCSCA